ncbi:MAG: glycoside hydrolase family 127 protein [Candidatus Hermodarchaeota archaeon]
MEFKRYVIQPVPLNNVKIDDNFWAPRIKINHEITIPHAFQKCEKTGRIDNFSRAAGLLNDDKKPIFPFDDSDVFKVVEGAAYSLIHNPDLKLEKYVDNLIEKIVAAQEDDGYLYTTRTINPEKPHIWAGKKRWELVSILSHELYNMGHLIEAGIGYNQATCKQILLNVAIKCANLIDHDFGPNKIKKIPGHQEIEIALIRLYKITNNKKYLYLAKFFLDLRGTTKLFDFEDYSDQNKIFFEDAQSPEYNQSHKRIIEQDEAVGHVVRAIYMYSAITEMMSIYKNSEYKIAIDNIWNNVISKKLYITGGLGARSEGESFGDDFELPNLEAYAETCAAIANIFWNFRLFLLYGDAKYIDVLERTLYNGFLSGISIKGNKFFYTNPLASKGNINRRSWYKCPCCPTNIVRFIPQIPGYIYTIDGNIIFINLFIGSIASIELQNNNVKLIQESSYPWSGDIKIKIYPTQTKEFSMAIRIPGWARDKPVPSDLYSYLRKNDTPTMIKINGEIIEFELKNGFALITRVWQDNDIIELNIPMPIRRVLCNSNVEENIGKVVVERGPIVYCIESIDNEVDSIFKLTLNDNDVLETEYFNDILGGITRITGKINFIPYYSWANRGKSEMRLWVPRDLN